MYLYQSRTRKDLWSESVRSSTHGLSERPEGLPDHPTVRPRWIFPGWRSGEPSYSGSGPIDHDPTSSSPILPRVGTSGPLDPFSSVYPRTSYVPVSALTTDTHEMELLPVYTQCERRKDSSD